MATFLIHSQLNVSIGCTCQAGGSDAHGLLCFLSATLGNGTPAGALAHA